ncbi:MAG: hypothetical protein AAGD25_29100 [Cyanobacteria bacterium P01_F01_bin.150]
MRSPKDHPKTKISQEHLGFSLKLKPEEFNEILGRGAPQYLALDYKPTTRTFLTNTATTSLGWPEGTGLVQSLGSA